MKKRHAGFLFIGLVIITLAPSIFIYHNEKIANFAWKKFQLAPLTLFLYPDAEHALEIGNYYFNVYGDGVYNLERAERYFYRAIELDPNVPDAWHQLARIDFLQGHLGGALYKINNQISLHGDSFMASYYIRGLIYGYRGEYEEAEKDFLRFLEWDPNNWAIHNDLAWIYFQQGEYTKGEKIAREGLVYDPENAWLLNMLGIFLLNTERKNEAVPIFEKALARMRTLKDEDWQRAYPGNDPGIAALGLEEMIRATETNLALAVGNSSVE